MQTHLPSSPQNNKLQKTIQQNITLHTLSLRGIRTLSRHNKLHVCVTACEAGAVLAQCVLSRPVSPSHLYLNDATMTPSVTANSGQKIGKEKYSE